MGWPTRRYTYVLNAEVGNAHIRLLSQLELETDAV
jgi:hypothetical protein